jgi:hypothetical protein
MRLRVAAEQGERVHEPERSGEERALAAAETVDIVDIAAPVAEHEPGVVGQLLEDRLDGPRDVRVVGWRKEA